MSHLQRLRIAGLVALCLLLLSATSALACVVVPNYQPDAQIALSPGLYVGNDIYNTTAAGQETSGFGPVLGSTFAVVIVAANMIERHSGRNARPVLIGE